MPWWRNYFDEDFFQLHDPLFPAQESRREVGAMLELLGLPLGARILDLPCGWGRHTNLFNQAGLVAFGADLSVQLLRRAAADADAESLPLRFAAADLRSLPFQDEAFDAAVNVFTSLGIFARDEDDLAALGEVRRVLRPAGRFLLESMHRDDVVSGYAERDHWTLPDGTHVTMRRRFDAIRGVSHERMRWEKGEVSGEKTHKLRLRTATEVHHLLHAAGFTAMEYFGDWDARPFSFDSPRLIAVATR